MKTVVVGLEPRSRQAALEGFSLALNGATRTTDQPLVVRAGERIYGVFQVEADDGVDHFVAAVDTDEEWELAAVMATVDPPPVAAQWLGSSGLARRLTGLATVVTGSGQVSWNEPGARKELS